MAVGPTSSSPASGAFFEGGTPDKKTNEIVTKFKVFGDNMHYFNGVIPNGDPRFADLNQAVATFNSHFSNTFPVSHGGSPIEAGVETAANLARDGRYADALDGVQNYWNDNNGLITAGAAGLNDSQLASIQDVRDSFGKVGVMINQTLRNLQS